MIRFPVRRRAVRSLVLALSLTSSLTGPVLASAQGGILSAKADAATLWRNGDRAGALAAATGDDLLKAELLDALGRVGEAVPLYTRARDAAGDASVKRRIGLRLAIIAAVRRPETLLDYARQAPPAEARRLADILALLGRPRAALALAETGGGVVERLTTAQWALAAGENARARDAARAALAAAVTPDDRRYAIALLVEAYRNEGALAGALNALDALPPGEPVASAKVDVLLELGRPQAAIALIEESKSPALRRRLTGVLDLSGDRVAAEAEYRRLIAADPHQADLYARLGGLYLTQGDEAKAVATYAQLFAANRGRADVLTAGARAMIGMGLQDQAVAMLAGSAGDPAVATATHLFRFETYLDRGDTVRALAELQAVERGDRGGMLLADIADGYERLSRPDQALALLRRLEARGGAGYDIRARIAQLAADTGHDEEALTRWRALWTETTLPARRNLIERQIVALAKRMNRLAPLAQEISARLEAGTIRPGEIDLLVALRLAQDKPDMAADAVRRFAARSGQGEAAVLNQLARLYGRVHDYDRLDATLARLIAIDPGHRDANIRQLILTRLRHDDGSEPAGQRQAELDRLMAQLSDTGEGGAHAFRATVYAQANLNDQALRQLREGLAARPDDPDALSRLATELKRQHRRDEAIGLLQYAVDHDGPAMALSAIDSLIDMMAGVSDAADADTVLDWAKRRVLERIAESGPTPRLLALLADVAAADADLDLQIRATEAMVPGAGEQRGYVLRELATLSGGGASDGGSVAVIGDPRRKLVYARRLLALGKSFPPDLYADLARTLLTQGDEAGAERAFAMMNGLGGLVNVDEAKGDAYAAAGRPDRALTNYARALLQDQSNLDLLIKTSILQERAGQDALAARWYWRGLRDLLARQPLTPLSSGDERGLDVRRYYPTLTEGLLLTWPDNKASTDAILNELNARFAAEMARGTGGKLEDQPRLALIVDLGHRIVDAGRGDASLAGWDAALETRFQGDPAYRRMAALRRHLTGRGDCALPSSPDWPLAALQVQAADTDNGELSFVLALSRGDMAAARGVLAAALASEAAAHEEGAPPVFGRGSSYLPMLADAMDRLSPDALRDLVLTPLQASKARDAILFDLFRAAPDRYLALEKIAGTPLLSADALVQLTITRGNRPLMVMLRVSRHGHGGGGGMDWLDRFSPDQLIALYDGLVTRLTHGEGDSGLSDLALSAALRRPLSASQKAALSAVLDRDIAAVRDARARSGAPLVGRMLQFDALPANRDVVLRAAQSVAARYADSKALPLVLERWYAGDKQQAYIQLATMGEAMRAAGQQVAWLDRDMGRYFPDTRERQIEAFLADPSPDPKVAALMYQRFAGPDGQATPAQRLALTKKMIALDPGNPLYRERLLALHVEQADWAALAPVLRDHVTAQPDDRAAATMLAMVDRLLDRPDQAMAVAKAAEVDPDDPDWLVQLLNRSRMLRAQGGGGVAALFGQVYDAYLAHDPRRPAVIAVEARQGRGTGPVRAGDDSTLGPLLAHAPHDDAQPAQILRGLWRHSLSTAPDGDTERGRRALVYTLSAAAGGQGTGAALLAEPAMTAEMQRYPGVMTVENQARQQMLYDVIAYGPARRGEGTAVLAILLSDLRAGRADADAVHRLVALADRIGAMLSPEDLGALDARLRAMPVTASAGRVALARLYARSASWPQAEALLRASFLQMLYPAGPLDNVDDLEVAMKRVVATVALWPTATERNGVYTALAQIMEKRKLGANGGDLPALPPLGGAEAQTP